MVLFEINWRSWWILLKSRVSNVYCWIFSYNRMLLIKNREELLNVFGGFCSNSLELYINSRGSTLESLKNFIDVEDSLIWNQVILGSSSQNSDHQSWCMQYTKQWEIRTCRPKVLTKSGLPSEIREVHFLAEVVRDRRSYALLLSPTPVQSPRRQLTRRSIHLESPTFFRATVHEKQCVCLPHSSADLKKFCSARIGCHAQTCTGLQVAATILFCGSRCPSSHTVSLAVAPYYYRGPDIGILCVTNAVFFDYCSSSLTQLWQNHRSQRIKQWST
jgi:hypothetical protein